MILDKPIETERLFLREIIESDLQDIHSYFSNPDVLRYMEHGAETAEDTQNYLKRIMASQKQEPRMHYMLAIILKSDGALIGGCDLHMPNLKHREGEIIYRLNPKYWGKGFGTEAAKAMINFGFKKIGLHRIEATCDVRNNSSIKVLEKIGMIKEGCLREHKWIKNRWRDSFIYSILEHENK